MNLFEKIFSYQVISRLEDSGTFMVTSHERSWLKTMLQHSSARDAFSDDTLLKLQTILQEDQAMEMKAHLEEKARSSEKQVYHPLLRSLRSMILARNSMQISYGIKGGQVHQGQLGIPYKLEYSMVKREWYLLWFHLRNRSLMSTKLARILSVFPSHIELQPGQYELALAAIDQMRMKRKATAVVEVLPAYNKELSRILYAFSCLEKEVEYDAQRQTYSIRLFFLSDESEFLLSKIRFLGKRVRVIEGSYLKRRMLEASIKALARYEQSP
ncbi:WYL domain-containing protein [Paenibacillus solisilvae]|uniref:WYL domain-containing protein n=1 Tax=Paenibacillus solisilvae TaxID=2486751 RepID=A0ABW0VWX6_9BACL